MRHLEKWLEEHLQDIHRVQAILANPLPDDPGLLDKMLREVDAEYCGMNTLYADALAFYDVAKRTELVKKRDGITDLDREIIMRAETSEERRICVILEGVVEAIKSRLILGMSLRKAHVGEGQTGGKTSA